jgi:hypothetical protein
LKDRIHQVEHKDSQKILGEDTSSLASWGTDRLGPNIGSKLVDVQMIRKTSTV